jgi:hypothetical protein
MVHCVKSQYATRKIAIINVVLEYHHEIIKQTLWPHSMRLLLKAVLVLVMHVRSGPSTVLVLHRIAIHKHA